MYSFYSFSGIGRSTGWEAITRRRLHRSRWRKLPKIEKNFQTAHWAICQHRTSKVNCIPKCRCRLLEGMCNTTAPLGVGRRQCWYHIGVKKQSMCSYYDPSHWLHFTQAWSGGKYPISRSDRNKNSGPDITRTFGSTTKWWHYCVLIRRFAKRQNNTLTKVCDWKIPRHKVSWAYGGRHQKSCTNRDFYKEKFLHFGPWNTWLRFIVANFWRIVAVNCALDRILENSLEYRDMAFRTFGADLHMYGKRC